MTTPVEADQWRKRLAKHASEKAGENANVAPQLLYAPVLWALQDFGAWPHFSGLPHKSVPEMTDVRERAAKCPQCGGILHEVRQSASSPLNEYQWRAQRAGDYYCETCPDNGRGTSGKAYFWEREVRTPDIAATGGPSADEIESICCRQVTRLTEDLAARTKVLDKALQDGRKANARADALQQRVGALEEALTEVDGCFEAAYIEGLAEVLPASTDERLVDLITRRILFAREAAVRALTQNPTPNAKTEGV